MFSVLLLRIISARKSWEILNNTMESERPSGARSKTTHLCFYRVSKVLARKKRYWWRWRQVLREEWALTAQGSGDGMITAPNDGSSGLTTAQYTQGTPHHPLTQPTRGSIVCKVPETWNEISNEFMTVLSGAKSLSVPACHPRPRPAWHCMY